MPESVLTRRTMPEPPDTTRPWQVVLYAHTHWDREWYQPFERFRMQLIGVIDRVLDVLEATPDFTRFTLDGQTIVLDDYLEMRPENRDRVESLVRSGRLEIGPWYVLPDEFLVSGESLIRNLARGHRDARRLGGAPAIGYIPDPFGHVAQIPQLLHGFGIEHAMFSRGMDDRFDDAGSTFRWQSPDGTGVTAYLQTGHYTNGYCNAERLQWADEVNDDLFDADFDPLFAWLAGDAKSNLMVLACGVDHDTVYADLPERARALGEAYDNADVRIGGLTGVLEQLKSEVPNPESLAVVTGELRGAKHTPLLSGIFSARVPVKQENVRCQTWLERYIEPLTTLASNADVLDAPRPFLDRAWKLTLDNHPHDSIGGCSVDHVHDEMHVRTNQVDDICRGVLQDIRLATATENESTVFNPHPTEVGGWAESPDGRRAMVAQLTPFQLVRQDDASPTATSASRITVARDGTVENDWLKIGVDGTLGSADARVVIDRKSDDGSWQRASSDALAFVDVADAGDEYDFSPLKTDATIRSILTSYEAGAAENGGVVITVEHEITLPGSLTDDRAGRSTKTVPMSITTQLRVSAFENWVDATTTLTNTTRDHRLRLQVALEGASATSAGDSHFAVVERDRVQPEPSGRWSQQPSDSHSSDSMVAARADGTGMAVFHRGLHEYQLVNLDDSIAAAAPGASASDSAIQVTLLRCVEWLSRDDIDGRIGHEGSPGGHAGPGLHTPGAQCIGDHEFRFALHPFIGEWAAANVPAASRLWSAPLLLIDPDPPTMVREPGYRARRRDVSTWRGGPYALDGIGNHGFSVTGAELSACMLADDDTGDTIVRVYNPLPTAQHVTITPAGDWSSHTEVMLDDHSTPANPVFGSELTGTLPPWRIATIRVTP